MVARLVVPDYGCRKEAMAQTVETDIVDSVNLKAEVQVTNMKAGVTRRPYDTNLTMSVHSLLWWMLSRHLVLTMSCW